MNQETKFTELFNAYSNSLPNKLKEIETLWVEIQKNENTEIIFELHRKVHSLYGSSGIYGYNEISQAANELQIFLKPLQNTVLSSEQKLKINTLLTELKNSVQRIVK